MTALELRLIGYGLLALLLIGGAGTGGYKLAASHYERVMQADEVAQQSALVAQQEKNATLVAQQQAASVAAETQYEDLRASATTLGSELAASLRDYTALRGELVPARSAATSDPHATSEGTGSSPGIADVAGQAATACEEDAAELTALQSWARSISQPQR